MLQTGRRDTRYRRFNRPTFLPVHGCIAASDVGEETAWTKINGSSVHAHTDMYLCIVARNHSWIHINCVMRFQRNRGGYVSTRNGGVVAAGYRFTYRVIRKQSFATENCRSHLLHIFDDRLFFSKFCHGMNITARSIIWKNKTCDEDKLRCLQFVFKIKIPAITDYESLV